MIVEVQKGSLGSLWESLGVPREALMGPLGHRASLEFPQDPLQGPGGLPGVLLGVSGLPGCPQARPLFVILFLNVGWLVGLMTGDVNMSPVVFLDVSSNALIDMVLKALGVGHLRSLSAEAPHRPL